MVRNFHLKCASFVVGWGIVGLTACSQPSEARELRWDSVRSLGGNSYEVEWTISACATSAPIQVVETSTTVEFAPREIPSDDKTCSAVGVLMKSTVALKSEVGNRRLLGCALEPCKINGDEKPPP